jgi:hypothetical protein
MADGLLHPGAMSLMIQKCTLFLLALLQLAVLTRPVQANGSCALSTAKREALLDLPFQQFDQEQGNGWRPLYASKCYREAAALLEEYVRRHPDTAREQYMLSFHTGQLFALAGEYARAIQWMKKGYSNKDSDLINWTAFVDANVAFLNHDYQALLKQRNLIDKESAMAEVPGVPKWAIGKKMNLDVVNGFLACFSKPYNVAYDDECRRQGEKPAN